MDFVLANDALLSRREGSPRRAPMRDEPRRFYSIDAESRPLTEFSGDFYFSAEVRGELWFALGDFAGHGLQAAIYSAMIQEETGRAIQACAFADPAEVVASLHASLRPEFPINRFASLVVGRLRRDGRLQLSNAGHCAPVIRRSDGSIEVLDSHGPVVGLLDGVAWRQVDLWLSGNDRLLLYSDGLIEATSECGDEVSTPRVVAWTREAHACALRRHVLSQFDAFTRNTQTDDVTVMVIGHEHELLD